MRASRRLFLALALAPVLVVAMSFVPLPAEESSPERVGFRDDAIAMELPATWHVDGESGEYMLESDEEDVASLLLLPYDGEVTLEERLAEIEEQFLATDTFELLTAESRTVDDEQVSYRRYRLEMAGAEEGSEGGNTIHLHQYTFWRDERSVLLQVESAPGASAAEELFQAIFETLELLEPPLAPDLESPAEEAEEP